LTPSLEAVARKQYFLSIVTSFIPLVCTFYSLTFLPDSRSNTDKNPLSSPKNTSLLTGPNTPVLYLPNSWIVFTGLAFSGF
jgi:hypothetical protein